MQSSRNTNHRALAPALPLPGMTALTSQGILPLDQRFLSPRLSSKLALCPPWNVETGEAEGGRGTGLGTPGTGIQAGWEGDRVEHSRDRDPSRASSCLSLQCSVGAAVCGTHHPVRMFCSLVLAHKRYPKIAYSTFYVFYLFSAK